MRTTGRFIASARLIALLTLGSRVLGVLREGVFSYFFATSGTLSAFRIAFMAPNLARRLFGEGALSSAMIPVLTDSIKTRGDEPSRRFVGSLIATVSVVLLAILLAAEAIIVAWRGIHDDPALALAAVLMPYMAMICTVAVFGGVLNVRGHFASPAAAPMLLNVGVIVAVLVGSGWLKLADMALIRAACVGVLIAGVLQLLLVGGALRWIGFFPIFGGRRRDPQVQAVMALMGPMILGLSAVQINSLVDYLIAYLFVVQNGERVGPAVLGYAQYLYQLPLGVFGIAVATAIYPELSKQASDGHHEGLAAVLARGLRLSLFIALPATVGLMFVARPLVASLYERGAFDAAATARVAGTLVFYSVGMAAYFSQHLIVRAFYALKDSRTPASLSLRMVGLNLVMNLGLVFVLEERGLALATAVCAIIQTTWLSMKLRRLVPARAWGTLPGAIGRTALATTAMTLVLLLLTLSGWLGFNPLVQLAVLVPMGGLSYVLAAKLLHMEELTQLLTSRHR